MDRTEMYDDLYRRWNTAEPEAVVERPRQSIASFAHRALMCGLIAIALGLSILLIVTVAL